MRISDWSSDVCSSDLADRDRGVFQRIGTVADRGALLAGGDGGEACQLAGIAVPDIGIAAQRGGAVTGGLAAGAVRGGVGGTGQAVQAGGGGVLGERHRAAAERRRAVTDRIGRDRKSTRLNSSH